MSLHVRNVQVDVPADEHDAALAWWAAALGGTPRTAGEGFTHLDGVRARVGVHVQRTGSGGGYHLDLAADDVAGEVARLVELGAELVDDDRPWTVLRDPAGLAFCVTAGAGEETLSDAREGEVHLRVLMLDVPGDVADVEAAFWADALDGDARPVGERYPEYTWVHGVQGPGGDVDMAVQATGGTTPRLHVDLHCPTPSVRDVEVDRLTGLGAEVAGRAHHWVVLRAPGGMLACVVPDRPED